jgi:amidase
VQLEPGTQRAAVKLAADLLRTAGHEVGPAEPPYPSTPIQQWSRRWWAGIAIEADQLAVRPQHLERRTRAIIRRGHRVLRFGGPKPAVTQAWRERATSRLADYDLLLSPAVATIPGQAGALNGRGYLPTLMASARSVPFCQAWNLAGLPALVIPVGVRDGLPLAVKLVGGDGEETKLLTVGAQIESPATPPGIGH